MIKNKFVLAAIMIIIAVGLSAQNKSAGINISLWKGVSTQPLDSAQTTYVNLGLFSSMNKLHGVGINALASSVKGNVTGIQLSGLANMTGESTNGVQLSGLANVTGEKLRGVAATGLVNIAGSQSKGVMLAGLMNIAGERAQGIQVGGLMNLAGNESLGLNVAGVSSIVGGTSKGVTVSGLLNVGGETTTGVQIAGLSNIVAEDVEGIQVSGAMNVAGGKLAGLQVSPVNIAYEMNGLQIGICNYYHEKSNGFQLGLVNANPDTRIQLMLFGGNATKINAGVRFKNKLFYTILGMGTHYLDFSDDFSASAFYRAGLELPLCKNLFISGDLGYQHIEMFDNKSKEKDIPGSLYALQARLNLEYRFTKKFGIFATGGYGGSRYYDKSKTYDKGVIAEFGVVLF